MPLGSKQYRLNKPNANVKIASLKMFFIFFFGQRYTLKALKKLETLCSKKKCHHNTYTRIWYILNKQLQLLYY